MSLANEYKTVLTSSNFLRQPKPGHRLHFSANSGVENSSPSPRRKKSPHSNNTGKRDDFGWASTPGKTSSGDCKSVGATQSAYRSIKKRISKLRVAGKTAGPAYLMLARKRLNISNIWWLSTLWIMKKRERFVKSGVEN